MHHPEVMLGPLRTSEGVSDCEPASYHPTPCGHIGKVCPGPFITVPWCCHVSTVISAWPPVYINQMCLPLP